MLQRNPMTICLIQHPLALNLLEHLLEFPHHFYNLLHLQDAHLAILHLEEPTGYQENHSLTLTMRQMKQITQTQSSNR